MQHKITFLLIFCLIAINEATAQQIFDVASSTLYPITRRPAIDWHELETPHFSIIYPSENVQEARETGRILEAEYSEGKELVGGSLHDFPVILNPYNDRSNGFVSAVNFRMEIDLHPLQGKVLNPQSGNWLEAVVPHELIHALQANHHAPYGFSGLVQLISPDLARSIHTAVPMGVLEGLAVHHETKSVLPDGGRGNYSYFKGPLKNSFSTGSSWSMGQLMQTADYTRPFNRHYIGGYEFTRWLQQSYGSNTSRKTINFYSKLPFLGYGVALRHQTGKWPAELYDQFAESVQQDLNHRPLFDSTLSRNTASFTQIPTPYKGSEIRRPLWLSDTTLLFHGSFYNGRPGFYHYDLVRGQIDRLFATRLVNDYHYDLSKEHNYLLYARYHAHPYHSNRYNAKIHTFPLYNAHNSNSSSPISSSSNPDTSQTVIRSDPAFSFTHSGFAPAFGSSSGRQSSNSPVNDEPGQIIWSIENRGSSTVLARHYLPYPDSTGSTRYYRSDSTKFVAVQPHPRHPDTLAIVGNRRGVQGLWLVRTGHIKKEMSNAPDIAFQGGSIFDPRWHPSKERLLFTSDYTGTMQVYELYLQSRTSSTSDFYSNMQAVKSGTKTEVSNSGTPSDVSSAKFNKALYQLTNHRRNAYEASYSPSGNKIAYIIQKVEGTQLATLQRTDFLNKQIPKIRWTIDNEIRHQLNQSFVGKKSESESIEWSNQKYSAGLDWLRPRTIIPTADTETGELGLQFYSTTPLQQQNYKAELTYGKEQFWYDLSYHNVRGLPPFEFGLIREPISLSDDANYSFLEHQQYQVASPVPLTFEQNVFNTRLQVRPSLNYHLYRAFNNRSKPVTGFSRYLTFHLQSKFTYRLQQNIRDVQPNNGALLLAETRYDLGYWNATRQRRGSRIGGYLFISPLRKLNQSLRLGSEWTFQSQPLLFNTSNLGVPGFRPSILSQSRNLFQFSSRYTIPLWHPDNGGFLIPLYLSRIYLVGFSKTIGKAPLNSLQQTRSIYGGGIRISFRLSNLTFDIGIALSVEPTRDDYYGFIGTF